VKRIEASRLKSSKLLVEQVLLEKLSKYVFVSWKGETKDEFLHVTLRVQFGRATSWSYVKPNVKLERLEHLDETLGWQYNGKKIHVFFLRY
jgi:hypothetical protein